MQTTKNLNHGLTFDNLTRADHARYSKRGQDAMKAVYWIDGQPVGVEEVMARTGLPKDKAIYRVRRERNAKRTPLTWEGICRETGK